MMYRSSRIPHRRTRVLAAVAVLGSMTGLAVTAHPATAAPTPEPAAEALGARSTPGACTTAEGVTVVIDFQELGGGSYVRCAPNAPETGFEALEQAGIDYTPTTRSPGFLCRIAGKPAGDPCHVPSPATAYWSYWLAPRGGRWCYANLGAGNRRPPAGTVEGWSFVLDKSASATPPPKIAPPAPLSGVPAPQLPRKDCTVPTEGATTTTTQPPSGPATTRPSTAPGTVNPSGPSKPTPPASPTRPGSRPGRPSGNGSLDGSTPGSDGSGGKSTPTSVGREGSTSTTSVSGSSTSTTPGSEEGTSGDGANVDGADPPAGVEGSGDRGITDPEEIAALEGNVDLSDDGRSKGSPLPLVAGGVVITGLVAGGVLQRRRGQADADPT